MNEYFIGDPFTEGGIICGTGAIVTAADGYLADTGSALRAYDITGSSPEELYRRVRNGQPVVVWVTISMADRRAAQGWYTENGDYVDWSTNDHGAVLIGYTERSRIRSQAGWSIPENSLKKYFHQEETGAWCWSEISIDKKKCLC